MTRLPCCATWDDNELIAETPLMRAVLDAYPVTIGALLGQGELTTTQLVQRTGMDYGRLHIALAALEAAGRISSRRQDGPYPRRRLYRYAFAKGGIIRAREDA
jgi:DNA-binding transcriptional ArsR family regulator